jgi:hypothetical protein
MLNEPASSFDDAQQVRKRPELAVSQSDETFYSEIHAAVETVMDIAGDTLYKEAKQRPQILTLFYFSRESQVLVTYEGRLNKDSEVAYEELDDLLHPQDMVPVFRCNEGENAAESPHIVHVVKGRVNPKAGGNRLSLILLLATILSVLSVGAMQAIERIGVDDPARAEQLWGNFLLEIWRGWPYALSIMLILGAHEMGHYLMSRRHRLASSLPYFLPFPMPPFGTFGAAIRLREPIRNRKMLLDVGAAGPFAGMIFAVPIVLIGLATSPVHPIQPGLIEGNSILYALSKVMVFGRFLPDGEVDVYVNQLAWAGWTGLLITGLNLLPIGQLDGGHILYAMFGKIAKLFYIPIMTAMLILVMFVSNGLIVFVLLIFLMGNTHAVPLDDVTALDARRRLLAIAALVLFVVVFVPMPLTPAEGLSGGSTPLPTAPGDRVWLPVMLGALWLGRRRFLRR